MDGIIMEPLDFGDFLTQLLRSAVENLAVSLSRRDWQLIFVHEVDHETDMSGITFAYSHNRDNQQLLA